MAKEETGKKTKKKRGRRVGITALILVAAIGAGVVYSRTAAGNKTQYTLDTVTRRDLEAARTFTGTVSAGKETVLNASLSDVVVDEVLVEKGDRVKKGDVIARLSTDSVNQKIEEQEAALKKQEAVNATSVGSASLSLSQAKANRANDTDSSINAAEQALESAQETYNNLANNISQNLDPNLQSAQNQMTTAFQDLVNAQNAYNNEVALNNEQLSSNILSAQSSVDSAYSGVQSAALALSQAQETRTNEEKKWDPAENDGKPYDPTAQDQAVATAQQSLTAAWDTYHNATKSYEAAKSNEENSLTDLYDALLKAQKAYLSAVDSYNAEVNSLNQELVKDARAVQDAQENLNTARTAQNQQIDTLEEQVQSAQASADVTQEKLELEHLKDSLGDYIIKAPASGIITDLKIAEGSTIGTGSVCTIADFSKMKVAVKIGEYDLAGAKEGASVQVSLNALPDRVYTGKITSISRTATVDNGVSYFASEVAFTPDDEVRSGMSCEVRLVTERAENALSVNAAAVFEGDDGKSYCLVTEDGGKTVEQREVTAGISDGTNTEIKSGLSAGETVCYTVSPVDTSSVEEESEESYD